MRRYNEQGVALIAAVMVVAILAGIGISFSFNMRLEEKAAANYLWKTQADAIAQGGLERAIQHLIGPARRNEQFTHLGDYSIPSLDVPLGDGLTVRSVVEVRDEAGKVNLNVSGDDGRGLRSGFARSGIDRGWTTAEIVLPPAGITDVVWRTKFGGDLQEGASGVDDNQFLADGVTLNRFGANSVLGFDGIDNDGDGVVDNLNAGGVRIEGIDEPSEFVFLSGGRITLDPARVRDDRPFITTGETEVAGIEPTLFTTLYSRDRFTDQDRWWPAAGGGELQTNINTATEGELFSTLQAAGLSAAGAAQVAVNIVDFRDADNNPTVHNFAGVGERRGIERTLFVNEVWSDSFTHVWPWPGEFRKVEAVELINPWTATVTGHYLIRWVHSTGTRDFDNRRHNVPAGGIIYRYDEHQFPDRDVPWSLEGGRIELWGWIANANGIYDWRLIESVQLSGEWDRGIDAKNDPRVPGFTSGLGVSKYYGNKSFPTVQTGNAWAAGGENRADQGFAPAVGGEVIAAQWRGHGNHFNRGFHNIGELGLIHTGGQWETIPLRNIDVNADGTIDRWHQGALLNRVTIGHPYNRTGRININTAPREVLTSLPQMFQGVQTEAILARRGTPFMTIGEVVPHLTAAVRVEATIDVRITQLMQWIQDVANWAVHWPTTWGWPLSVFGRSLHNWMLDNLMPLNNPPMRQAGQPYIVVRNPADGRTYVNFFASPLTIEIVRGIANWVANITQSIINWARANVPDWFGWRESLITRFLTPIIRAATSAYDFTLAGDDLDRDDFRGEDDERETIVRSVSNLITTRSDRFEVISTGSVWRAGEKLAESRMRVIVCRISNPATILHFERR
jgi:type II secretory pathway component PulK